MDRLEKILNKQRRCSLSDINNSKEDRLLKILNKQTFKKRKKGLFQRIANFFSDNKAPNRTFEYVLDGKKKKLDVYIPFKLHDFSFADSIQKANGNYQRTICNLINSEQQKNNLSPLINSIKMQTSDSEKQARIAISLVQHIPYKKSLISMRNKSPFETASSQKAVCGGKSNLLSFLLKELGFGNAIFLYSKLDRDPLTKKTQKFNHANVGIKCSPEYQYEGSGYAIIETTQPKIISDYTWNNYSLNARKIWNRRLPKIFSLIKISDGLSLNISKEYYDAQEFMRLNMLAEEQPLSQKNQKQLSDLYNKYLL